MFHPQTAPGGRGIPVRVSPRPHVRSYHASSGGKQFRYRTLLRGTAIMGATASRQAA